MRKIRDFIYNISDIFITLLVIALAAGVIFWRVQVIMGYSAKAADSGNKPVIDIDFSNVDLNPIPAPNTPDGNEQEGGNEDTPKTIDIKNLVIDESFKAYKTVYVSIPAGSSYDKAIRLLASAFEDLSNDQYAELYNQLWHAGISLDADTRIQIDTFTIPEGTDLEGMIRIICRM